MDVITPKSNRFIDITGKRFGKLVAIHPIGISNDNKVVWSCKCDCGNTANICGKNLRNGDTKSCGCYRKYVSVKNNQKDPYYWTYHQLQKTAKDTNKICQITFDEFLNHFVTVKHCHYCNSPIKWEPHRKRGMSGAYNIDRKDNKIGYTVSNCVVCCSFCNRIKCHCLTYDEMMLLSPTISIIQQSRINSQCQSNRN